MAGGHVWWGTCVAGGVHGWGGVAEETAIAADGTYPPGMHACYK